MPYVWSCYSLKPNLNQQGFRIDLISLKPKLTCESVQISLNPQHVWAFRVRMILLFIHIFFATWLNFLWFDSIILMTSNNNNSTYNNLFEAIRYEKLTIFLSNIIEHYSNDGVTFIVAQSIQYITSYPLLIYWNSIRCDS